MRTTRYATSRQKACQQCSAAKAKCDRRDKCCTRCAQRGILCTYLHEPRPEASTPPRRGSIVNKEAMLHSPVSSTNNLGSHPSEGSVNCWDPAIPYPTGRESIQPSSPFQGNSLSEIRTPANNERHPASTPERLDFSDLHLFCPIDTNEINSRWMNHYIPDPEKKVKHYPTSVVAFISRILESYAAMATRGQEPAFVHALQKTDVRSNTRMATCMSLVRICQDPLPGSEGVAVAVLQREMKSITAVQNAPDNDLSSLAAFQAYLIYALVLYFRLGQGLSSLRQTIMPLQAIAHRACGRGIVCVSDQTCSRPKWEEWIVAEAKRRTLYVMYLFDGILCAQEGLPVFFGSELQGLPAPGSKCHWQVKDRVSWDRAFNVHLAEWVEGYLTIDELWPIPVGFNEQDVSRRQKRVNRWVEDVDEFGTMLYAVTACTHGT
ncbi:hypothetical protein N7454_007890 [Penicillium verhagenii]|nr:hypothetical protein N7454_007890 [Penicillium verhagenii]